MMKKVAVIGLGLATVGVIILVSRTKAAAPSDGAIFSFGTTTGGGITCPEGTAYWIPDFRCTISNDDNDVATHTIHFGFRYHNLTYDTWGGRPDEYRFSLTLVPGESYIFDWLDSGIRGTRCYPTIMAHRECWFYLVDEHGNKSPELYIYRS